MFSENSLLLLWAFDIGILLLAMVLYLFPILRKEWGRMSRTFAPKKKMGAENQRSSVMDMGVRTSSVMMAALSPETDSRAEKNRRNWNRPPNRMAIYKTFFRTGFFTVAVLGGVWFVVVIVCRAIGSG